MKKLFFLVAYVAISCVNAIAQNVQSGLPVSLALENTISSKTAKVGTPVNFTVASDVYDNDDNLVIPEGTRAFGSITNAKKRGCFGKPGNLAIEITHLILSNGKGVNLQADNLSAIGKKKMAGKVCAYLSFWVWPIFVGVAIHGGYAVLNEGTPVQAYTM